MKALLAGVATLMVGGCATEMTAHIDHDRSQDFKRYESYSWVADEPMLNAGDGDEPVSPLNRRRIVDAIEAEMTARGIRKAPSREQASFTVAFTVGARDHIDMSALTDLSRRPWSWGDTYFGNGVEVGTYRVGTLAIDIFDGGTRMPVWHGWVSRVITNKEVQRADELIPAAVKSILAKFPPKSGTPE
jgi:hypothetical protein